MLNKKSVPITANQYPHLRNRLARLARTALSFSPQLRFVALPSRPKGISIMVRVKDEADWIRPSIESIKGIADEIIVGMRRGIKMTTRKSVFVLILTFVTQHLLSQNAFAYLDPGTGSYIFQVLMATIVAGLFAIKMFWQKIKGFFLNNFFKKKQG